ncbi:hypothetical protein [Nocardioides houyundeii]|uniref:hypothetical protein n=1 Tax=Nocardioides houyundeii TaxID=2045452 RepID=UPI000C78EFD5|nr:hypothetical protein [Nocardioides houyundeii]
MGERAHHRPMAPGDKFFDEIESGGDPALLREAADRAAVLMVRGARASGDDAVAERVVHLAETEGLEVLAELWSGSPADSLAGALWRLYLLRSWVYADPERAAVEFEAGRRAAPVARVVAGVADPPGPEQLRAMVDAVLRGIVQADFADVLHRAAAFAHVVAVGRATRHDEDGRVRGASHEDTVRMLGLAEQLESAARQEMLGELS